MRSLSTLHPCLCQGRENGRAKWGDGKAYCRLKTFILNCNKDSLLVAGLPTNEKPGKHPFFIKRIPHSYSPYGMKNMNKGDYKL